MGKFDDVVSKVEEALKTPDSQGTYADYVELLKLYDKTRTAPRCWLSWTTSCATSETRSPRRMCRRCSLRSATLRMRTVCSPTCPSSTGSPARPKNPTKLQSQASKRPWQHGTLLKKIWQLPLPLGVTKQHQKQPKLQCLQLHPQTRLHKEHQWKRGAWRIYIKPKHFCLS